MFTVEPNRLILHRATSEAAGTYQVIVRNANGEDRQELKINVEPRRNRGRGQQAVAPTVRLESDRYTVGYGEVVDITPNIVVRFVKIEKDGSGVKYTSFFKFNSIQGGHGATITWYKDGSTTLPEGVTARSDGALRIEGRSDQIGGQYTLDVINSHGRASGMIYVIWKESKWNS